MRCKTAPIETLKQGIVGQNKWRLGKSKVSESLPLLVMLANCWAFNLGETNVIIPAQPSSWSEAAHFHYLPSFTYFIVRVSSFRPRVRPKVGSGFQSARVDDFPMLQWASCACRKRAITENILLFWKERATYSGRTEFQDCWSIPDFYQKTSSLLHAVLARFTMKIMMAQSGMYANRDPEKPFGLNQDPRVRMPQPAASSVLTDAFPAVFCIPIICRSVVVQNQKRLYMGYVTRLRKRN
ncbi:hypothetical protein QBC37DRAFT_167293 [Rhypophila decipiens]|uniref:Uncharacterized protein n=1 Tax=Rhypophila decipiens TaxID=261697 RepID=A0AAN6YJ71_9PEZI|nr:hypothetical protein QBC37DRAFT_167293 [Rhypophila decipiens]